MSDFGLDDFNFSKKKKKTKNPKPTTAGKSGFDSSSEEDKEVPGETIVVPQTNQEQYSFEWLLHRFYEKMGNPIGGGKIEIPPLNVERLGKHKIIWTNFGRICEKLDRDVDHIKAFFISEIRTDITVNIQNQMILRGRFGPADLTKVLTNYVKRLVICQSCKGSHTELQKERGLLRLSCLDCHSVVTIDK